MHRHMVYINGFSLLRQWSCSCLATCESEATDGCLYYCFVTFISTQARHRTYHCACVIFVDVEPYRLTISAETCITAGQLLSQYNPLSSPPVFHECTSYSRLYPYYVTLSSHGHYDPPTLPIILVSQNRLVVSQNPNWTSQGWRCSFSLSIWQGAGAKNFTCLSLVAYLVRQSTIICNNYIYNLKGREQVM